ncbi:putative amino-acid permease C15C4.04c [Daldinia childiae]|uniref:putative amino-acid permease C15C4.04c n=1 Tax=Daldinia childiae TaxID=326645 RepID=UPI0014476951|nr:putative amino-acid permease C15C4.04c [Daldinia childiae]KAF3070935.1 putative amino-acid permease C15C4.04c [Daldinia childiae]
MSSIKEKIPHGGLSTVVDFEQGHTQLGTIHDVQNLTMLGYKPELRRNRSMFTLLFQSLAIAAIPYGFGGPLISAIYGGGQLPMFLGWIVVLILGECIALSLGELASRYPTSAGPYYWSFQLASPKYRTVLSFITGWTWLIGNWTITLSVNFGFASMLAAAVSLFKPDFTVEAWQLLLIFYAVCILTFFIVAFGNAILPLVDTICAIFTAISIVVTCICLSVKADVGRHSPSYTLGHYDTSLSGWEDFSFWIGILPAAYTFSAIGMISSMAEECGDPTVKLPNAISLCIPVGGIAGLFFIIPLCATLPDLADVITAPVGQALPYIFGKVMGSPGGGLALTLLVLIITLFCSISITCAASRCTWAFARDNAIPFARLWSKIDERHGTPIWALVLTTLIEMLLGLINLGSSSAFLAFVSVGVISLAVSYGIPIAISLFHNRKEVNSAKWTLGKYLGLVVNLLAIAWILFEVVLFSMPTVLPVTEVNMNYAIVVFVGFMVLSAIWYGIYARKVYRGPPESDGLAVDS